MKRSSMMEKYLKVVELRETGVCKTVEEACKIVKMSPASYHIYKNRHSADNAKSAASEAGALTAKITASIPQATISREDRLKIERLKQENQQLKKLLSFYMSTEATSLRGNL